MSEPSQQFDAFLAHNDFDKPSVEAVAANLRKLGVKVWLDREQIPPGRWYQDVIQQGIQSAKSIVVFLGPTGVGQFQLLETRTAINQCMQKDIPVIPVLLPKSKFPENLLFLKDLHYVQLKSVDDKCGLEDLKWGITGKKREVDIQQIHSLEEKLQQAAKRISLLRGWGYALFLLLAATAATATYAAINVSRSNAPERAFNVSEKGLTEWRSDRTKPDLYLPIPNLSVPIITSNRRPVAVMLTLSVPNPIREDADSSLGVNAKDEVVFRLKLLRDKVFMVGVYEIKIAGFNTSWPGTIVFIDNPDPGKHDYTLYDKKIRGEGTLSMRGLRLIAYEL